MEQINAAQVVQGTPCAARAAAVIANSGTVSSNSGSLVDSYQSSVGPYGGANVGSHGKVQAGGAIIANGGVIHGTQVPNTPAGLAVVPVPAGATNLPLGAPAPGAVNINNAAQSITLAPGNYVATNINVNANGAINISPAGQVLIWVTGNLNLGGFENQSGIPQNLQFLLTSSSTVSINSGGRLFGFVYAPTSPVFVNSAVFGGVTGSAVTLNSGAAVHLDDSSACPAATGATHVSVGLAFACATLVSGNIECWGTNGDGELANDPAAVLQSNVPVPANGFPGPATAISAGGLFTCGLTAGGAVLCWGFNSNSELGNGTTTNTFVPTQVTGLTSGVTAISAGVFSACAIVSGGGLRCWGAGGAGQLGNGTTTNSSVPVQVTGLTSGVTAVSVGTDNTSAFSATCAIVSGAVKCWGRNNVGQLGNGTTTNSNVPVQVTGLTSGVSALSVGSVTACAVNAAGGVVCWGSNSGGQLGNAGVTTFTTVPVPVTGLASGVTSVAVAFNFACALTSAGGVQCWGTNTDGQLGNPGAGFTSAVPVPVTGLSSGVTAISADNRTVCALLATGGVDCWGFNDLGELGNNSTTSSPVPVAVVGLP